MINWILKIIFTISDAEAHKDDEDLQYECITEKFKFC